jgi:serine/threonine protein kinase
MTATTTYRKIGEGSYGCVIKPAVECEKPQKIAEKKPTNRVSKIFVRDTDFDKEYQKVLIAAKVDPNGESMAYPHEYCIKTEKQFKDAAAVAKKNCKLLQRQHAEYFYIMNMPYGGKRIDDYVKTHIPNMRDFLRILHPIVKGLKKLEDNGYCHQDIKLGNLLVTPSGDGMIIDFTLMVPLTTIYSPNNARRRQYSYFPYPPEYKIYEYIQSATCEHKVCNPWPEVRSNIMSYGAERSKELLAFMGGESEFEKASRTFYEWAAKQNRSKFNKFAKKVDVYSLGVVCGYLYEYIKKEDAKLEAEWKKIFTRMMHPDPRSRIGMSSVAAKLDDLLGSKAKTHKQKTRGTL